MLSDSFLIRASSKVSNDEPSQQYYYNKIVMKTHHKALIRN